MPDPTDHTKPTFLARFRAAFLSTLLAATLASAQPTSAPAPQAAPTPVPSAAAPAASSETPSAERTQAERIISLRRLVEADRQQRAALDDEQGRLRTQFDSASANFERLDAQLTSERDRLNLTTDAAQKASIRDALPALQRQWTEARDRFDAVIQRRKAVQDESQTLADKIAFDQEILASLTQFGATPPVPPAAQSAKPDQPAPAAPATTAPVAANPTPAPPISTDESFQLDQNVVEAMKEENLRHAAVQAAEQRLARLDRGIDIFDRDLVSSRRLLDSARHQADISLKALAALDAELQRQRTAGAPEAQIAELTSRRAATQAELDQFRQEVDRQNSRVVKSESTVDHLKQTRADAVKALLHARAAESSARNALLFYESPVAPHRLRWWAMVKGPRVLAVIIAMLAVWWLSRIVGHRILASAVRRGRRGTQAERDGRAETIRRAFESGASAAIAVLGVLAVLHESGIDVTVLLGGTAIVGAAIAFGSQNMVHDYFGGFMILIENQYSVGNVIRIGDITGTVEGLTLRMTSVRDLEGVLHFIPHSQVSKVSNLTYGWSRIVFDIKVASGEDVDRVMAVLMDVARDLAKDPTFGPQLIDEPEMLGVDSIAGSAVSIKLLVKAQPLRRWAVKRELLRRIKKAFDAQGIKMA